MSSYTSGTICSILLLYIYVTHVSADVLYPWGAAAGDSIACSAFYNGNYWPDKPFKLQSTRGLPFFGSGYTDIYVSPNGFISDIAADGLSPGGKRKRFPLSLANNTWENCNTTADPNCWLTYYYDFSVWNTLVNSQNDSDVCVNGKSVTDNFNYDTSIWNTGSRSYTGITDPGGCITATHPNVNYPNWMIAVYWAEMEVIEHPASVSFRETVDSAILAAAKADVECLSSVSTFNPSWAFVFTWTFMTYPQGYVYTGTPENSFQIVIATDGSKTYGIYNYNITQLGGGTVGFDSGDGTNYCSFIGSRTASIKYVASRSNIDNCADKTGRWVIDFSSNFDNTTCEPLRTESVSCECDEGWEGRLCASSINDCTSTSCPSYALCIDGHMNFTCDYCYNITCKNNGVCQNQTDTFNCNCTGTGYNGTYCELCGGTLECQNSATCAYNTQTNTYSCDCATGFSGTLCEASLQHQISDSAISAGQIAGITIGIIAGLAALACLLIFLLVRKKKKEEEKDKVKPFVEDGA